jgi:hypothetical protein
MRASLRGLDHVLVGVKDLAAAARTWSRLGFTCAPLGRHVGRKTGNHCIMFADDYVELIGIVDPDGPASRLDDILARQGDSLIAAALAPVSPEAAHDELTRAGLAPQDIVLLRRPIEAPDGSPAEAQFRNFDLPLAATPGVRLFFCAHLTPELVRRPDWLRHANGARGVAGITVAVADVDAAAEALERLFGPGSVTRSDGVATVQAGRQQLIYATPDDLPALYPEIEGLEDIPAPRGVALRVTVADADAAAGHLESAGVPHVAAADGALFVAPAHANGVLLQLG